MAFHHLAFRPWLAHMRQSGCFRRGDHVVYTFTRWSNTPAPGAHRVSPLAHGEGYSYVVEETWTVVEELGEQCIEVATPSGRREIVRKDDPQLRKTSLLKSLELAFRGKRRFPRLQQVG
jgi:hypothetical protein